MHKVVDKSDISNDNVALLEIVVMFNDEDWRICDAYVHVDNMTNDNIYGIS